MEKNIVLSAEQINEITTRLGHELSDMLRGAKKVPLIVGVMKGSLNFMMDLMKHLDVHVFTDYIQVSSYEGTTSSGKVRLYKDILYDYLKKNANKTFAANDYKEENQHFVRSSNF